MEKIEISKVKNGYLIQVTKPGVQSIFEKAEVFVANDKEALLEIISEQL